MECARGDRAPGAWLPPDHEYAGNPAQQRARFSKPKSHVSAVVATAHDTDVRSSAPGSAGSGGNDAHTGTFSGDEWGTAERSFAPGNRGHGHRARCLPAQVRYRAGGYASMAWTATGGSVAALSRGAWTPPRTPAAVGDRAGGPCPCPAKTDQRESSGKIACTSPTSIGLERRCRFQPG